MANSFNALKRLVIITGIIFISIMNTPALAEQVGLKKAKQVSANWIFEKSRVRYDVDQLDVVSVDQVQSTDIYYVINYPSGGWSIVSADDVAQPIIAYAFDGAISPSESPPPQFSAWMENVKNDIYDAITKKTKSSSKSTQEWDRLSVASDDFDAPMVEYAVAPLLTTTWNQGKYYNAECPEDATGPDGHVYTGCVATAMAQVIKYHNWPERGSGSHSYTPATHPEYGELTADFENTAYGWGSMPNSLTSSSSAAQISAVATLIYHCGVSVDMDYTPEGSAANTSDDATNALKSYFCFHPSLHYAAKEDYSTAEWLSMLQTELNNSRPVLYRGSGTGGHAFVCDGFGTPTDSYFHFNWGWGGAYDGYFLLSDLTPGSYNFNTGQGGIFGIRPLEDFVYPYAEDFETDLPAEWGFIGDRVSLDTTQFHSGAQSVLLSTEDGTGLSINSASLFIDVPSPGASLSFWVKRGYNPAVSLYNQQIAQLLSGTTVLHTFYDGDFNDSQWQEFTLDLSPWVGLTYVKLHILQQNQSSSYSQWTYLDDVSIAIPGDVNGDGALDLADAITALLVISGADMGGASVSLAGDCNGDDQIGIEEVIYILEKISNLR